MKAKLQTPNRMVSRARFLYRFIATTALYSVTAQAQAQSSSVQGVDWSKYAGATGVQPGDLFGQAIADVLQTQSRYLYSTVQSQHSTVNFNGSQAYNPLFANGFETALRPLASFAWTNAAMIKTDIYNPTAAGLSQNIALSRTERAILGVAMTHRSNNSSTSTRWGQGLAHSRSWQAALWASQDAEAAWMLWDRIGNTTKQAVTNMVRYEANSFINYEVPYWDGLGGDTKAEENAWNSRILVVAQAMMPDDPNADLWRQKASELMVSSYSRPSDLSNTTIIDGKPVNQWLNGYNTLNDGIVINHDLLHPNYVMAHSLTYTSLIDASLAGQYIPESAFFNAQVSWDAMTKIDFVAGENPYGTGANHQPGGTVFQTNLDGSPNPAPYYPNGDDWAGNVPEVDFMHFDLYAHAMNLDEGQAVSAMDWAAARVAALQDYQNRPGHTGNFYELGDFSTGASWLLEGEAGVAQELAEAWMVWWLSQNGQISPVGNWGIVPEPSAIFLASSCSLLFVFRGIRLRFHRSPIASSF